MITNQAETLDSVESVPVAAAESPYDELLAPKKRGRKRANADAAETVEKITALSESPNQVKSTGWSADDIETIALGVALLLNEGTKALSKKLVDDESLAMDSIESDIISKCLTRMFMRHIKVSKGKRGDVADGTALIIALATYGVRVYDGVSEHKKKERENARSGRVQSQG